MKRGSWLKSLVGWSLLGALHALPVSAGGPSPYSVGSLPVAGLVGDFEFPLAQDFNLELVMGLLSQGTFQNANPFADLSLLAPAGWAHYDGVTNLRLSAGLQEVWTLAIPSVGQPAIHEDRLMTRIRFQQPRGTTAIYELLQLNARSFTDPTGTHRWVFQPRLRVGSGFNLDAQRISSVLIYQEVALRFAADAFSKRTFDFYRSVLGYTWTTRRGTFITAALAGQVALNPAGTRLSLFFGPLLSVAYRIFPKKEPVETPPEPPEIELQ